MPTQCRSLCFTDLSSSPEPSHPLGFHLAPVIAADGPGSSHPPNSSNGMVLPLIWTIPFLSQGPLWPIFLATPYTAIGDSASPRPAPHSSAYLLALAFTWPFCLFICLGNWTAVLPPSVDSCTFILSYHLDLSPRREYRAVQ